ncbi:uncharacterized protein LOC114744660 [Neltuma alba]|uniref:uncharacterized protein LOC114732588 n=1 Tax=Neltuma alba TaxID=207710 RepID=UPI0010A5365E|nr:uncharacterized protein LOC114732588 [Prosopis alba]XP_028788660.1 uncharacterized protein LOC114744660 [Prosopis alba]
MSFSGIGIGLSVVFGFLLLALIAQLYYLLWRKRRRTHAEIGKDDNNYTKRMLDGACWKTLSSLQTTTRGPETKILETDVESGVATTNKDVVLKSLGEDSVESELMRLHNLAGPPRFLFTIKEETKEDLESEDGKSRRGSRTRSLSDLIVAIDTPFLTPLPSSPLKSPSNSLDSYKHQGFNPLFESLSEPEINRFRSSPPPKFKFLRDAEEKLYRRMTEEAHRRAQSNQGSVSESGVKDSPTPATVIDERDGSFLRLIKNRERDQREVQQHQVLPLTTSPTTFRPPEKESMVR